MLRRTGRPARVRRRLPLFSHRPRAEVPSRVHPTSRSSWSVALYNEDRVRLTASTWFSGSASWWASTSLIRGHLRGNGTRLAASPARRTRPRCTTGAHYTAAAGFRRHIVGPTAAVSRLHRLDRRTSPTSAVVWVRAFVYVCACVGDARAPSAFCRGGDAAWPLPGQPAAWPRRSWQAGLRMFCVVGSETRKRQRRRATA